MPMKGLLVQFLNFEASLAENMKIEYFFEK